jgi:hypothetical protein
MICQTRSRLVLGVIASKRSERSNLEQLAAIATSRLRRSSRRQRRDRGSLQPPHAKFIAEFDAPRGGPHYH